MFDSANAEVVSFDLFRRNSKQFKLFSLINIPLWTYFNWG